MLNIVPCSDHENLPVVRHGDHVFHTALELVKKGETKFRVSRDDGEDYDLEYTENMNLFPGPVKTMIMKSTGGQDLHPLFLDYDENLKDSICLEFLEQFNRAEFECLNEYTVALARVILNFTDMPVCFRTAGSTGSCRLPTA